MNHSLSILTFSTNSVFKPSSNSFKNSTSLCPSIKSIEITPSLLASSFASCVNVPVVIKTPCCAFPSREPLKLRISGDPTVLSYLLAWKAIL